MLSIVIPVFNEAESLRTLHGELSEVAGDVLLSMAVRFGSTRLIDNFLFERGRWETGIREG